jgi:hypothetical protein
MSLPQATKDVSDHPAKGSVVDPVNKAEMQADIDRKIKLYGVFEAFRQGRMPNNKQIDDTLQYVLNNSPVDVSALSPQGRQLIQDTRDIIDTARKIVVEKNADELFQQFVWHTRDVDVDRAKKDPGEVVPVSQEKAKADGKQAVQHLRTLLSLVLTNSEVRKLLSDFTLIGRDLLAKGASKAAANIAPDQERMARVDHAAPQDQFITEGGRVAGPNETPVLEARVPFTDKTVVQHPHDELGTGAKVKHEDGTVQSGGSAMQDMRQVKDQAQYEAANQADYAQQRAGEDYRQVREGEADPEQKKAGFMDKMRGMRDNLTDRIPDRHKDRASDQLDRTKEFFSEEYFPPERRDQFIFRGKKVIIECQKHDDYQESIRWLLDYLDEYASHGRTVADHGKDSHGRLTSDPSLQQAMKELRTLLERFANGKDMSIMFDAVNALIDDARRDPELREWFKQADAYIRRVLLQPGFVIEPACNNEANALKDSGRRFYDDKYRDHFDNLFSSIGTWFRAMGDDPLNLRFGEDWARLTKDLLFDSEGSFKYKPELWMDLRKVIIPTLVEKVGYIPIPRIEYTDDTLDLVVENLALTGRNLFPNFVSFEAQNYMKFSPYNTLEDKSHHEFTLTLGQMQADMRDVAFFYRKKTGIPKLSDSGLADVLLGGEGLTATIHLSSADKDRSSVFKVKNVVVKVDTLKFSIRDSKHDFLYKTLKPLATGLVKKQIQKAIADAIQTGMEYIDGQLVTVRDRMESAKVTEGESRTQVLQDMFKRKKDEASLKTAESKSQFKVVSKKRDSMLASEGHPAGWVNRTDEKAVLAGQGNDWHSPAFDIV